MGVVKKTCEDYNLIEENDKIAIGISGGKDSLLLLTCMANLRKYYPKKFEIVAISVDLCNGKTDYSELKKHWFFKYNHCVFSDWSYLFFNILFSEVIIP